ncbi:MAG TPA: chromate transporter [Stellaceae bacterium]|nr:chromate transporter [Stellaceae bacterium]
MPQTPIPDCDGQAAVRPVPQIGLARIFVAFLQLGCTSFGGGTAGWLYRDIVAKRRWLNDDSFLLMLTVGQVVPGSNGVKLAALIGQHLAGAAGAAAALAGLLGGPFAIVLAIAAVYSGLGHHPIVYRMLDGVAAAVVGLTLATGLRSLAHGAPGPAAIAIAGATVVSVGLLDWPILPVVAVLAPLSVGLAFAEARRR